MLLPLLAMLATPLLLMLLRQRPAPLLAAALAGCAWPLLLPLDQPLWRAAGATLAGLMLVKSAQLAAGHERPQGALDTLLFLVIPAVAQWQQPRVPDPRRARRSFATGALQFGAALCLVAFLQLFAPTHPAQLLLVELYVYAGLAAADSRSDQAALRLPEWANPKSPRIRQCADVGSRPLASEASTRAFAGHG